MHDKDSESITYKANIDVKDKKSKINYTKLTILLPY